MKNKMMMLLTLCFCLFATACSPTNELTAQPTTLRLTRDTQPQTFHPHLPADLASFDYIGQMMEGLVQFDDQMQLQPALATTWDITADGLTYTFTLREDSLWTNGDRVKAQDFVFAYQLLAQTPAAAYQNYLEVLANGTAVLAGTAPVAQLGAVALDDRTLVLTLAQPLSYFLDYLAFPVFYPLSERAYHEIGATAYGTSLDTIVTNSAYILSSYTPEGVTIFAKNPTYYDRDAVTFEHVHIQYVKDQHAAALLFDSGQTDVLMLTGDLIDRYQDHPNRHTQATSRINYLYLDATRNPALANNHIRHALASAIDKQVITTQILKDGSIATNTLIPTAFDLYSGQDYRALSGNTSPYSFDVATAQELWTQGLADLGGSSVTIEIAYNDSDINKKIFENIQNQLTTNLPGLTIQLKPQPQSTYPAERRDHRYEAGFASWNPDYFESSTYFNLFTQDSPYNYGRYHSAAYDELLKTASTLTLPADQHTKLTNYQAAEQLLLTDAQIIPLFQSSEQFILSDNLSNYTIRSMPPSVNFKVLNNGSRREMKE